MLPTPSYTWTGLGFFPTTRLRAEVRNITLLNIHGYQLKVVKTATSSAGDRQRWRVLHFCARFDV